MTQLVTFFGRSCPSPKTKRVTARERLTNPLFDPILNWKRTKKHTVKNIHILYIRSKLVVIAIRKQLKLLCVIFILTVFGFLE